MAHSSSLLSNSREALLSEQEVRSGAIAALKLLRMLAAYYLKRSLHRYTPRFPFARSPHAIATQCAHAQPPKTVPTKHLASLNDPATTIDLAVHAVSVSRLGRLYAVYGDRFTRRILTDNELIRLETLGTRSRAHFLARSFSEKRAVVRALGTRLQRPVALRFIGLMPHSANGRLVQFMGPLAHRVATPQVQASLSGSRVADLLICIAVLDTTNT